MNPFSIICQSCAARLKVTKPSAIGQNLACPSCGSMVHVAPPEDWVAPPDATSESGLGSSFEDIDSILPTTSAARPKRSVRSDQNADADSRPRRQTPQVPVSRPVVVDSEKPVLPGDEWTSSQTRARKRLILMVTGCLATVLLVAAVITAIVLNRPLDNDGTTGSDALASAPGSVSSETGPVDQDGTDGTPRLDVGQPATGAALHSIPQGGAFADSSVGDVGKEPGAATDGGFTAPVVPNQTLETVPETAPSVVGLDSPPPLTPASGENPPLDPQPDQTPVAVGAGAVDQLDNRLGDLASLLRESDASLQDLQDAAVMMHVRSENGITKYLIEPPEPANLNLSRQLDLPVAGMLFEQPVPMTQMLRLVTTLSGVPITIDARSIILTGRPINPDGKLKLTDASVLEAVEAIASQFGLAVVTEADGLVLTTANLQTPILNRFDFPAIPDLTDTERSKFVASIQSLIAPQAWLREADPATIEIDKNQLVVNAEPEIQLGIQLLIEKLDAAASIAATPDGPVQLVSRWTASRENRQLEPDTKPRTSQSLAALLNHLHKQTGTTVLVDWRQVMPAGWTASTQVPGNLDEPTVDGLVDEVARAMDLTVVSVDATTLLLTTRNAAKRMIDLEVYPVSAALAKQLDADTVEELIFNTLGAQLQDNLVRVIYEPKCRAVIVIAPQAIQRQIESILQRVDQR